EGLYPVMGHHDRPLRGYETKVVALADRLSAGERLYVEEEQPEQLLSIFCSITVEQGGEELKVPENLYWPLQPLHLDRKALFPEKKLETGQIPAAYSLLWKSFEGEIKNLLEAHQKGGNLSVYLESLLLLLQRYTWCVPSAYYRAMPDVSLYDHSRITAALAVCLLDRDEAILDEILRALEKWGRGAQVPEVLQRQEIALLVGGDISGVQDFIYTITARGATSALRGRSFYLQLLTEAVARYTIRRLGLPATNLLYQGGGGFYLLARPADRENLENIRKEVSRILLAHHRGDLYLALTWVPLVAADFYDGRISGRWEELGGRLQKAKQSRFVELKEELADLFKPEGYGGTEEKECKVCSREHPDTREEAGVRKCPPCLS
ncbi:MAG: type III-A CRISPR-associated protein Cas10/Csm1, partial [Anaerolineae bacterium]|nr:type III-A CRISPR-associated protein Cas10/Csm1 [Anaerolineae bacterium]